MINREEDVDKWERLRLRKLLDRAVTVNLKHIVSGEDNKAIRKFIAYLEEELLEYDYLNLTLYDTRLKLKELLHDLQELQVKTPEWNDCYYKDKCKDNCGHTWPDMACMWYEVEKLIRKLSDKD